MKKRVIMAVAMIVIVTMVFATACGGGNSSGGGSSSSGSGGGSSSSSSDSGGAGVAADTDRLSAEDAYQEVVRLLANPELAMPLSGVEPKWYPDRSDVYKAIPTEPCDPSTLHFGLSAGVMGSEFFEEMWGVTTDMLDSYGITWEFQNADLNLETQKQQMQAMITNKCDAIYLSSIDIHSSTYLIQESVDAGIPVIILCPTAAKPEYPIITNFVGGGNEPGFQVGLYCAEKLYSLEKPAKVSMLLALMENASTHSRAAGWIAGWLYKANELQGTPYESKYQAILDGFNVWQTFKDSRKYDLTAFGLDLVDHAVAGGMDAMKGTAASTDLIVAHPDMDLLWVEMDSLAIGAIAELKTQGYTPGVDILVSTCADGTKTALDFIKSGELFATATNHPATGSIAIVEILYRMFTDPSSFDWVNNLPETSFTPTEAVTIENVDLFYDPNSAFAKAPDYKAVSIPEYNELHKND